MKRMLILWIVFLFSLGTFLRTEASERERELPIETAAEHLDFQEIEQFLNQSQKEELPGFQETMELLLHGELIALCGRILESLQRLLFSEIRDGWQLLAQVLALGIFGAMFSNFSSVFENGQVSETGFFVTYLLLFLLLIAGVGQSIQVAADTVTWTLDFMKVVAPVYFLAVAIAGGSLSAAAMYEITMLVITAAEWLLGNLMLPAVRVYLLLVMTGNLVKEDLLSRLTAMIEQFFSWGMKTLLGVVLGFQLIQGLVLPYVDSLKNGSVQKVMSMIPGIGQGVSTATQLLLGSGILIKNTIGMAAVVILLITAAVPMLKLVVLMCLYQCAAAILEPICDKRFVACVAAAGNGHKLLLKIGGTAVLLLVLTVTLVCAGTNVR